MSAYASFAPDVRKVQHEIDTVARALRITGDATARRIAFGALNGYRYERIKIARAVAMVRAFRALECA